MSTMTFTQPRATLDELLEFANRVRAAGGGNPLDALMPSIPKDATRCLIARNLNFNCSVDGLSSVAHITPKQMESLRKEFGDKFQHGTWVMRVSDSEIRDQIATALGLPVVIDRARHSLQHYLTEEVIVLPPEIGKVAAEFDLWQQAIELEEGRFRIAPDASEVTKQRLKEFWPYIESSLKEAYENATFVNENGEIVI